MLQKPQFVALTALIVGAALLGLGRPAGAAFELFSSGFIVPETISQAPAGFGSIAGSFVVPNGTGLSVRIAPANGGASTSFANLSYSGVGGVFLPASFGPHGGEYLTVGADVGGNTGNLTYFNSSGTATGSLSVPNSFLATPVIAPGTFGALAGQVIISDEEIGLRSLSAAGTLNPFVSLPITPFGMAFAPAGFGSQGGQLLVADLNSGTILSVSPNGTFQTFASLTLSPGQPGLRQIGVVPDGFGSLSGLLLASVSGSQFGGGTLGSLIGINSSGAVVIQLKIGSDTSTFDPRGFAFRSDGSILVSDTSSPGKILVLTTSNFSGSVPEPTSLVLLGFGITGVGLTRWSRNKCKNPIIL